MVIIQLAGGLGNQMFQYALYLQLKDLGREVKIDDVSGFVQDAQREPALAPFGITYERPAKRELQRMLDSSMLPWHRVRRKLFGRQKKSYFEESKLFIPEVLNWDDIYLEGYWQSEKYFWKNGDQLRRVYDTNKLVQYLLQNGVWERSIEGQKSAAQYAMGINNTCSVSVHVRRGDYLTPENQALFGGICTEAYYIEGMRLMRERYP
ncbi:MAG: alpha-1,2-fucosyltransferase, partial [Lachnospiraceae bacterium]|nr:alpha-1,2-fucosyltransferase [Lachnospiraceae bacterium]